jgi:DNA repair exonuclease SbcCD ATPase subunit
MTPTEAAEKIEALKAELEDVQARLEASKANAEKNAPLKNLAAEVNRLLAVWHSANQEVERDAILAGKLEATPEVDVAKLEEDRAKAFAELMAIRRDVDELRGEVQTRNELNQEEKRRLQAKAETEARQTRADIYKAAVKVVAASQAEIADKVVGQFVRRAQDLTGGILGTPLEVRDGDVGRFSNGVWIPWETFSGTEEALTFAGLSLALSQSRFRVVVMDEIGRFDARNKRKIVGRMLDLVADGKIDQFFGVDVDPEFYRGMANLPGFNLVTI